MTLRNSRRRIPAPDYDGEEAIFYPVAKVGQWEPFGYVQDPEDPHLLQPVAKELLLLEQAKQHLKQGFSLRDVANWLTAESGRKISHQGLKDRVAQDQKREKDLLNSRYLAKQFLEAYKKARRIEQLRLGKTDCGDEEFVRELFELVNKETKADAS
jgi:hypothetical protein